LQAFILLGFLNAKEKPIEELMSDQKNLGIIHRVMGKDDVGDCVT